MKLSFSWTAQASNRTIATCAGGANCYGISPICALLTENGGFLDEVSLPYIENAIAAVDAVLRGDREKDSWIREWLEAEFDANVARIYSMEDEAEYRHSLSTADFRRVLIAWRDFIRTGPRDGAQGEVEIIG